MLSCGVLFAVALAVRLVYLGLLFGTPFGNELGLIADARYYVARATEIASGVLFPDVPGFLSPAYCVFLGLIQALIGPGLAGLKSAQAMIGALSVVLLYLIGRRLFSEAVGLLAAGMLAVYATHVYYTGLLLPAILVVFLHLLLIWVLAEGWSIPRFGVAGLLVGIAVLAKANALLLLPVLALWVWLACPERGVKVRLARIALLCGVAAVTVAPVTLNNYRVSKTFLLVTTTGGSNLLKGNGPTATGTHAFLPQGAQATGMAAHLEGRVNPQAAAAQSRALADWAWTHMRTHPGRALQLFGKKLLLLFNAHEWGIRDQFHFVSRLVPFLRWGLLPFWAIVPLGLVGALVTLRAWRRVGLLHAVILVQIVSFVLIFVLARYRLVLVACLMPFAAWLILRCIEWVRDRQVRPLALALAGVLLLFAVGSIRFADLPSEAGFADQWAFVAGVYREQGRLEQAVEAYEAANVESWIDTRRNDARWKAWIGLAETQIALSRIAEAQENLDRLSLEMQGMYHAPQPHPYEKRIRELREQTGMLR